MLKEFELLNEGSSLEMSNSAYINSGRRRSHLFVGDRFSFVGLENDSNGTMLPIFKIAFARMRLDTQRIDVERVMSYSMVLKSSSHS